MRRIALFPGSFDPLTLGHLDLIERLSALYDEVVVGVMSNPAKKPYLEDGERLHSIERSVEHLANVRVALSHGATVDLARQCGAQVMVRGLRSVTDFEYETVLAAGYRYMAPDIETLFLPARAECGAISSSMVRDIHSVGGDVAKLVPQPVMEALARRDARKEK